MFSFSAEAYILYVYVCVEQYHWEEERKQQQTYQRRRRRRKNENNKMTWWLSLKNGYLYTINKTEIRMLFSSFRLHCTVCFVSVRVCVCERVCCITLTRSIWKISTSVVFVLQWWISAAFWVAKCSILPQHANTQHLNGFEMLSIGFVLCCFSLHFFLLTPQVCW